jgi:hypothetical protein
MIKSSQLAKYRTSSNDYAFTEQLKTRFAKIRRQRNPLFLNSSEFDNILHWKLRGQYGRQYEMRKTNSESNIIIVTGAAFTITNVDPNYELELRLDILCSLRGVGVPVASAVLALVFPEKYCVIDFRGWRQIFNENKNMFSISDYKKYLCEISKLAAELQWSIQEVDLAIWEFDRVNSSPYTHSPRTNTVKRPPQD